LHHTILLSIYISVSLPIYFSFFLMLPPPPRSTLFPYTTLFRSEIDRPAVDPSTARLVRPPRHIPLRHLSDRRAAHRSAGDRCSQDRKSTRLNSSHLGISYAVFCLKKKKKNKMLLEI